MHGSLFGTMSERCWNDDGTMLGILSLITCMQLMTFCPALFGHHSNIIQESLKILHFIIYEDFWEF